MADSYEALAKTIVEGVGGVQNVRGLTHCVTRLRFTLADPKLADTEKLQSTDGVMTVIQAGGQYQVVIGNKVTSVYDAILNQYDIKGEGEVEPDPGQNDLANADDKKDNTVSRLMGVMSSILMPTLPVLTAAGIIKGLTALFAALNVLDTTSGVYMIMYAAGDGFFYFLPIMLGYTSAKHFKCNEFLGAAIGAALVYPDMVNIASTLDVAGSLFEGTPFQMDYYNTFFGIPVIMPGSGYTSSVVPIMIAVWFASKLEHFFKKHLGEMIRDLLTPLLVLAISVPVTYLVIGPVVQGICGVIFMLISALFNAGLVGGLIGGALIGGGFGVLVMFGLHWVVISLGLSNIALAGFDYVMAAGGIGPMIGMAQGLCITLRTRSKKVRDLALPSFLSQVMGVGEPLMYSILIPLKKPYAINILGGAIGGAIIGALKGKIYVFGGSGLFGLANYVDPSGDPTNFINCCIGIAVGMVATFIIQWFAYDFEAEKRVIGE
ncbi:MAG: PTS transporter subunit EIIC [Tractidigestivibacter sp.]|jgi:PTS system beta-glucosides-specific IIC component|uniref:PTS transporter subunit EIIC n=1 Tax=Tractidigestivibacter sp. TaxID=2847320 RepID=UPI003D8B988E